jgi:hypothetical protein
MTTLQIIMIIIIIILLFLVYIFSDKIYLYTTGLISTKSINNTNSQNTVLQNIASQNIASQNTVLQNTVLQNTASQNIASQNTASQNIASQNIASQNIASQNIASQNIASQNIASQNIASQNIASQNTVSQLAAKKILNILISIPGMILWFDALDPNNTGIQPVNNSNITTWYDKSGLKNNATAVSPLIYNTIGLNGYPTLTFNASRLNGLVTNIGQTMTIFAVCMMNPASRAETRIIGLGNPSQDDYDSNNNIGFLRQGGTGFSGCRNGSYANNNPPSYLTPYLFETWFDGTNNYSTVHQGNNTTIVSVASTGNFKISSFSIGSNCNYGDNTKLTGFISEIIIYNTSLTTIQRQYIEGYLSWKWGIQTNLSSSHPYFASFT